MGVESSVVRMTSATEGCSFTDRSPGESESEQEGERERESETHQ